MTIGRTLIALSVVWGVAGLYTFLRAFDWWEAPNNADTTMALVLALIFTVLFTYFGVFAATRTVRAAIASAFVVTYLIAVTTPQAADFIKSTFGEEFLTAVTTILAFYFVTEGAVQGTKVVSASSAAKAGVAANDARATVAVDGDAAPA